jgi:rhodanese-related sulfurtransferase
MQHASEFLTIVNDAKSRIKETHVADVKAWQARGDDFVFVDVREDAEWANGHLPQAIHIGKGVIERDVERLIPDHNTKIVLYCGGGYRSALAADNLQKMGYSNVWSMDGGFHGWIESE